MHSYCCSTIWNPFYSCLHSGNSFCSSSLPCSISLNAANSNQYTLLIPCFQTFPHMLMYDIHQSNSFPVTSHALPSVPALCVPTHFRFWSSHFSITISVLVRRVKDSASQTLIAIWNMRRACLNADSHLVAMEQELRVCVFNKLPDAVGPRIPLWETTSSCRNKQSQSLSDLTW